MSVNPADRKTCLSKNVLQMKFMQRGTIKEEEKALLEAEKQLIDNEHWVLDLPLHHIKRKFIIEEPSFTICADLKFGRQSFQGFNPEIEKIYNLIENESHEDSLNENAEGTTISEKEMTERYLNLMECLKPKKQNHKRKHREAI